MNRKELKESIRMLAEMIFLKIQDKDLSIEDLKEMDDNAQQLSKHVLDLHAECVEEAEASCGETPEEGNARY